jgi:Zn-finger nucleic acid-binding protein
MEPRIGSLVPVRSRRYSTVTQVTNILFDYCPRTEAWTPNRIYLDKLEASGRAQYSQPSILEVSSAAIGRQDESLARGLFDYTEYLFAVTTVTMITVVSLMGPSHGVLKLPTLQWIVS